nr:hypothetical protein [Tanacetum cinerariifolium]
MRDPEREVGYGITDLWDEIVETLQGAPVSIDTKLDGYVREFETRVRQDTDEIYMRLDDEQTERQLLAGRLNILSRDMRAHAYTRQLMETEVRMSREAWLRATDASDLVHKDDDYEDPEEDPIDYLADGGDDGDDEEGSSEDYKDDEDDDMDIEADEEEEDHPAPVDSVVVASTATDQAPSAISIPAPVPMPAWSDSEIDSVSTTTPILSPPLPVLSPAPPPIPIRSLGYRAAMIRLRAEAASTSSLPLQPPSASKREDRPEVTLPPQKWLGIALGPRYEVGESSFATAARPAGGLRADYGFVATMDSEIMRDPEREVGYGITDSWDEIVETLQGAPVSTDTELGGYMREFEMRVRQDTEEIYIRLDDEQSERQLLAGRLNMLFRDRRAHAYTRHLMETEAKMSREAWVRSTDVSDLVRSEVMSLRTTVLGQMTEIRELHAADRRRQTVILELLRTDHKRSTEIIELRTALQG